MRIQRPRNARLLACLLAAPCLVSAAACGTAETRSPPGAVGDDGSGADAGPPRGDADGGRAAPEADAAERDAATDGSEASEEVTPYVPFDVNHVISTGQSNAVAIVARPILSTAQPHANLMFDVGVMTSAACDRNGCGAYQTPSSFVPLVEGDSFWSPVETISSGLANQAAKRGLEGAVSASPSVAHSVLVSLHGRSGNGYFCLRKGGCDWWPGNAYIKPFDEGVRQIQDAARIAEATGKSYVVRAVTTVHGEHDHYAYSSNDSIFPLTRTSGDGTVADYGEALVEWQRDYEAAAKAITAQTIPVPLLLNQYSHWNDVPTTKVAFQQLAAHVASKGKVVIVGPTYQLPYTNDCLHFTSHGERWLGEYFGKAYARIVLEGRRWEPLRPRTIARGPGATLAVTYLVPRPPLVLDTEHVTNPGDYGFEVVDAGGARLPVASVAVTAADAVTITMATPAAAAQAVRLRYAYTFTGCGGSGTTARGNVRDSDDTASDSGEDALWNWSVHFDEAIP